MFSIFPNTWNLDDSDENQTNIYRKDWKTLLNKDQNFKITPNISERYNFTKSYQCLIYFRSK